MKKRDVSRVEGFSDAVFGFALTLLVVSLEVPENIEGLKQALSGFLPFAASFAIICWIWFEHYAFFRHTGAEDGLTIALNCALLFVVLFFVYPLKYITGALIPAITRIGRPEHSGIIGTAQDGRLLMVSYSIGFVAVFAIFVFLYWNVLRKTSVTLTTLERYDARVALRRHLLSVGIGTVSIVSALLLPDDRIAVAGLLYFSLGPAHGVHGYFSGRAREKIVPSSTAALP